MTPPRVTVIVPVRDRRELLLEALDALDAQTFRDFEVLVADDGSTDGSAEAAESRPAGRSRVRVLRLVRRGAVAARSAAVAEAAGEVLAFTDSDCLPRPDWLERGVRAVDRGAEMVAGRTVPVRPAGPLERTVSSGEEGLFPTCNVFYRRSTFLELGGFEGRSLHRSARSPRGLGFGEDTLLAWAVRRSGRSWAYAEDAVVEHQVLPPEPAESLRRAALAVHFPALVREVPELRRCLLRKGILLGDRQIPVYATAAALASRRRAILAASLAWWAGRRLAGLRGPEVASGRRGGAGTARYLALEMALDAVTGAALVVGSVRSRRLVL